MQLLQPPQLQQLQQLQPMPVQSIYGCYEQPMPMHHLGHSEQIEGLNNHWQRQLLATQQRCEEQLQHLRTAYGTCPKWLGVYACGAINLCDWVAII